MEKLRIGLDIDDVLIKAAELSIELYNQTYETALTMNDWYNFSDLKVWGNDDMGVLVKRVVDLMASDEFMNVKPVEGAAEVLEGLQRDGHELFAVTGRSETIRRQTEGALKAHFPGIFHSDTVHFTDYYSHDSASITKAEVATKLELTHFVEDLPAHASLLAHAGIRTVLYSPGYAWNKAGAGDDVVVLEQWQEIGEYLHAEARK